MRDYPQRQAGPTSADDDACAWRVPLRNSNIEIENGVSSPRPKAGESLTVRGQTYCSQPGAWISGATSVSLQERKVVVCVAEVKTYRMLQLHGISRATAQVVWVLPKDSLKEECVYDKGHTNEDATEITAL